MTQNLLALAVKPLDVATPLLQARRVQQMETETKTAEHNWRLSEMGAEFRGVAALANSPEFPQAWAAMNDRLLQKGILDPQRHAQIRNTPSPLLLQQGLAMTSSGEDYRARQSHEEGLQVSRDVATAFGGGAPRPGGPQPGSAAPSASMLPAAPTSNDPTTSVAPRQVAAANGPAPAVQPAAPPAQQYSNVTFGDGVTVPNAPPSSSFNQPAAAPDQSDPNAQRIAQLEALLARAKTPQQVAAIQSVLGRLQPGKKFTKIGTNPDTGEEEYGFVNEAAGTVRPYRSSSAQPERGAGAAPPQPQPGAGMPQAVPQAVPQIAQPQQGGLPPRPPGMDAKTWRVQGTKAAVKAAETKAALQDGGAQVLRMVDMLEAKTKDPRFERATGPFVGEISGQPVWSPMRLGYEGWQARADKAYLDQIKQDAQGINTFMQRALLKGQGQITENERSQINDILGKIATARSAADAVDALNNFRGIVRKLFELSEPTGQAGSPSIDDLVNQYGGGGGK